MFSPLVCTSTVAWPIHAYKFDGRRFDCGDKAGFITANIALALDRKDIGPAVADYLRAITL